MKKYKCNICDFVYDEATGCDECNVKPNTLWKDIPSDFVCPLCGVDKTNFSEEK